MFTYAKQESHVTQGSTMKLLRGCWCNIVLNVHTPCQDKSDDIKDSSYVELGCVFNQFPRYDMKILLDDFSVKVGREDIFKLTYQE
jgi:hypothetical protein